LPPAEAIAVGGGMSCAVTRAHEIYCWGYWHNASGQPEIERRPVRLDVE
jgi:hypothetical protein